MKPRIWKSCGWWFAEAELVRGNPFTRHRMAARTWSEACEWLESVIGEKRKQENVV